MKLLVISYTIKVHCARSYREWNPNAIVKETKKDIPQTLVIAGDDPRFIELKKFYGDKPFHENDIQELLNDQSYFDEWFDCFFEDDKLIGEITTTPIGAPKLKSFKVINYGGLL